MKNGVKASRDAKNDLKDYRQPLKIMTVLFHLLMTQLLIWLQTICYILRYKEL